MARSPLNAAEAGMVRRGGPIPLVGLMDSLTRWILRRHLELMAAQGFDDVRAVHNTVFVQITADGVRLTDLADKADVSKQAMAELVDELVEKGYLNRIPDPTDGRAKLLVMAERGSASHQATLRAFAQIEDEFAAIVGRRNLENVRKALTDLLFNLVLKE